MVRITDPPPHSLSVGLGLLYFVELGIAGVTATPSLPVSIAGLTHRPAIERVLRSRTHPDTIRDRPRASGIARSCLDERASRHAFPSANG